jgi:hypothetical protein
MEEPWEKINYNGGQDGLDIILIAVMGVTGSGKSNFIRLATGSQDPKLGHDLESCKHSSLSTSTTKIPDALQARRQQNPMNAILVAAHSFSSTHPALMIPTVAMPTSLLKLRKR